MTYTDVHEEIIRYIVVLQQIACYKFDADDVSTPYQLEMSRQAAHKTLFEKRILPMLKPVEGITDDDMFQRTKEIFSNLDKVWKIYDATEFDLKDDECVQWLCIYLQKFLFSTETLLFLEGKTKNIHGIHL